MLLISLPYSILELTLFSQVRALLNYDSFCSLFISYLHRFDQELQQINDQNSIKGRQGRAHASREDTIKNVIERERELYNTCGIGKCYLNQLHLVMDFL